MKFWLLILVCATVMAAETEKALEDAIGPKAPKLEDTEWSRPYGTAGCGLGAVLIGNHDGQLFAGTTNATLFNQAFSISSGTSNCIDEPKGKIADNADRYIAANRVALAEDIARGSGETLSGLALVLGCNEKARALGPALQPHFSRLFPGPSVPANEITDNIIRLIHGDRQLAPLCRVAG